MSGFSHFYYKFQSKLMNGLYNKHKKAKIFRASLPVYKTHIWCPELSENLIIGIFRYAQENCLTAVCAPKVKGL